MYTIPEKYFNLNIPDLYFVNPCIFTGLAALHIHMTSSLIGRYIFLGSTAYDCFRGYRYMGILRDVSFASLMPSKGMRVSGLVKPACNRPHRPRSGTPPSLLYFLRFDDMGQGLDVGFFLFFGEFIRGYAIGFLCIPYKFREIWTYMSAHH